MTTLNGNRYQIQTILVNKHKFTLPKAIQWINNHGYKVSKVDETENFYRFRQSNPLSRAKYFSKLLPNGIELVFQYL